MKIELGLARLWFKREFEELKGRVLTMEYWVPCTYICKLMFFQGRAKGKVSCLWHTGASRTQPCVGRFLCDVEY